MRSYAVSRLIERYGAGNYLRALRRRHLAGGLNRGGFVLDAAEAYLAARLPRRAAALLATVMPQDFEKADRTRHALLVRRADHYPHDNVPCCSLTMIVRNEASGIGDALDSVDGLFDEIVVCDTGSADRTPDIVALYGARIIYEPWCDDFSRPRNRAIDACTSEWIFWMDADDRLDPSSCDLLQRLWRSSRPQAIAVRLVNRIEGRPPFELVQVRLFPRCKGVRFERRIHEQIMDSARRAGLPFSRNDLIRVIHVGYADHRLLVRKVRRNLPMIIDELHRAPRDPSLLISLGDTYEVLGERHQARETYRTIAEDEKIYRTHPDIFVQAHVNIALMFLRDEEIREAERYLYRTLYIDRTRAEAWYHLGVIAQRRGDEERALELFLTCARTVPPLRMTAVANDTVRLEAVARLCDILVCRRRYAEAEAVLLPAVKSYPGAHHLYSLLGRVFLEQMRLTDAATWFTRSLALYDMGNEAAREGMARIYEVLGDRVKAAEYRVGSRAAEPQSIVCTTPLS